jgi:CRP-like cAMP-binding protein
MPDSKNFADNLLLRALTEEDRKQLVPGLTEVELRTRAVIAEPHTALEYAYFPHQAIVSLVTTMSDGTSVAVANVGSEGLVGCGALLQAETIPYRALVKAPGHASRIAIKKLKELFDERVTVRRELLKYLHSLMEQLAQSAVCGRFHSIEQRIARCLLSSRDRIHENTFPYTQEFIAQMLGADRSSVTLAAGLLRRAGFIEYQRGSVTILDSEGLDQIACECYHLLKQEFKSKPPLF